MQIIALLRGVTPNGQNRIPKMSYLAEIMEEAGFENVKTYIQSGNILLETELSKEETAIKIHEVIKEKIGADLSVIIKTIEELSQAIKGNPFNEEYDYSRIHMIFTNDRIDEVKLSELSKVPLEGELFHSNEACFYLYLPREAQKKKLNTNFIEKKLGITATMRKINVIQKLHDMLEEME